MFNAQNTLCSWGLHSHTKQVVLTSSDVDVKLIVNVCSKCKCPKRKTLKLLFGKGNFRITGELFNELTLFLSNVVDGQSYGENASCYRTRTAKNLLIALQGDAE